LQSLRANDGRGTSRYVADRFGVSVRTAQRWLAGTQRPRNPGPVMAVADPGQVRSQTLRGAQGVDVGRVTVIEKSPGTPGGTRNVGVVEIDLSEVADLLDAGGSEADAEALMSDVIMDAYGPGTGSHLAIDDYPTFDLY
jgi:hypothetical protein